MTVVAPGTTPVPLRYRYTELEACLSIVIGEEPSAGPIPQATGSSARIALEQTVLRALLRPPCLVSFSGGRDSSTILAVATHVARREGLALPVPATNRFPGVASADESDWQERVVAHLGLDDWLCLDWTDELDFLGPYALRVLDRHGLAFPHNLHFHDPLMQAARGGSLMTGAGGDEIMGEWARPHARRLLYDHKLPPRRHVRGLLGELAPRVLRERRQLKREGVIDLVWLRPDTRLALAAELARAAVPRSFRWDDELERFWRDRYPQCLLAGLRALGADHDVVSYCPFFEPTVVAGWMAQHGPAGPPGRTAVLREVVGDLLPEDVVARQSKAEFTGGFFASHSRAFARQWSGRGLDDQLVDAEQLSREWLGDGSPDHRPHGTTTMLLRQAWIADRTRIAPGASGE